MEWGNLSKELGNIESTETFKVSILNFVRPRENSVFAVHDINGLKLLTCLRLNFSHWMNINFEITNDTINPMRSCGKEPEATLHYLLRCDFYSIYRPELLKKISGEKLLALILYEAEEFSYKINSEML